MRKQGVETLVLLIKYSEEEAMRLRLSPVVAYCLRMVSEELTKSAAVPGVVPTIGSAYAH
jgi:preprotein translocase subunit Sec61beta